MWLPDQQTKARFPFKRNRLRCVRCVNENRKKRKRLRRQAANHGCVKFSRNNRKRQPIGMLGRSTGNHDWLLADASACVSCGFCLRNARNASDCVWMETGLNRAIWRRENDRLCVEWNAIPQAPFTHSLTNWLSICLPQRLPDVRLRRLWPPGRQQAVQSGGKWKRNSYCGGKAARPCADERSAAQSIGWIVVFREIESETNAADTVIPILLSADA